MDNPGCRSSTPAQVGPNVARDLHQLDDLQRSGVKDSLDLASYAYLFDPTNCQDNPAGNVRTCRDPIVSFQI